MQRGELALLHSSYSLTHMRTLIRFAIVISMSTLALAQPFPVPQAITDPKLITSKPNANVEQNQQSLSIERLYMTRSVGATAWSPDGKTIAFVSNISGRNNLWLVPAEGGWPTQLTISDQRQTSPAWSPDGKWIAYISDYDGDEQWDIFFVSPKTGQVVNITKTREISEESPTWSPNGRYLAYTVKPKTSSVFEIDIFDTLMRDTQHLTTGTPKDKMNVNPIWSADNKWIAYTQLQAKGTDSNIFVAEVATGKSTLLTPHQGEQLYTANEFSPDGKRLLITSNAGNGYDNVGLLDIATKKIDWLTQDKWEIEAGNFSPDGKSVTWTANVDGNTDIYLHDLASGTDHFPAAAQGVNRLGGADSAFTRDGSRLLYYHNGPTSPNDVWVYSRGRWQIASDHEFAGGRRPLRGHGRTVSGALSQPRWQVDHLRLRVRAVQHGTQRPERGRRLRARRAHVADREFVQPHHSAHGQPGLHGDRAQLSRFHRLRQGISARQPVRHGRRRSAGCSRRRRLDQADRLPRPQEAGPDGRQLRWLHDHDGRDQSAGCVGGGRSHRALRQLVHRNRQRRSGAAAIRSGHHGRSGDRTRTCFHDRSPIFFRGPDQGAAAVAGRRQ